MGINIILERSLMNDVVTLQLLDGNEKLLTCSRVIVIVVTEYPASHLLTDDVAILIDECAFVTARLHNHALGDVPLLIKGIVLTAAIVSLE